MNVIDISIDRLKEYENNPRNNDGAVSSVAESIKEFGFKVPIVIDNDNTIIAGHTRLKAAKRLGFEKVPCIIADDLTPEQIKAFRLADNKTAEVAEWDMKKLEAELLSIEFDMTAFGFDEIENETTEVTEDETPDIEEEKEPITKGGDIWQLGRHRLICGDSTNEETVKQLMDGEKADLLLTDPPYNVAIENSNGLTIQNDNMSETAFGEFLKAAFSSANSVMKEGAVFYIWHADSEGLNFRFACQLTGWKIRQCLIWVKNALVIGRQDYQWKHEPCLYGWKDGAAHYFVNSRIETTVIDNSPNINKMSKEEMKLYIKELQNNEPDTSVIREDKPLRNAEHPTMKPVKLISYQIQNSSRKGESVLDIFGGSGTTLIACEQLDRTCYMCELDERYCDVIIKRWETLTGEKAVKIATL